jgi:hypothetical protein
MEGTTGLTFQGPDGKWYGVTSPAAGNGGLPVVLVGGVGPGGVVNISQIGAVPVIVPGVGGAMAVAGTSGAGLADDGAFPLKVGGVYTVAPPVLADGQRGTLRLSSSGAATTDLEQVAGATVKTAGVPGALGIGGTVKTATVDDGSSPVKIAGSDGVNVRTLLTDQLGNSLVRPSKAATYAASIFAATSGAGVLFQVKGSATKTVRITRVIISGFLAGGPSIVIFQLKRDTAAATGGVSAAVTAVPSDSANPAATATALNFTTAGVENGALGVSYSVAPLWNAVNAAPALPQVEIDLGAPNSRAQEMVLRGAGEFFSICSAGALPAATNVVFTVEWTEE